MGVPKLTFTRQDGQTGVVRPDAEGILAVIAGSQSTGSTLNLAATFMRPEDIQADSGYGRLASLSAYALSLTGSPVVCVQPTTAIAAAYGAMSVAGGGTSAPSAGATAPLDEWNVVILFVAGGTIGIAGITFQTSIDGGNTYTALQQLGTATLIVIANTGITVNLGAGTVNAAETISFVTTPAYPNSSDLVAALEALRVTHQLWDGVFIDTQGTTQTATIAAQLDTWLAGLESRGIFRFFVINAQMKGLAPYAAAETEAAYAARMTTVMGTISTIRGMVCADGAEMVDYFQGVRVRRPAAIYAGTATEALGENIGTDPAYVQLGPLSSCFLQDSRGNPRYHDENIYPGLDVLKMTTLRSFDGASGAFITNADLPSPPGSDYVYIQHLRVINRACEIAWQVLQTQLSRGVNKSPKVGPNQERYIAEADASSIESLVGGALIQPMKGQVSQVKFTLSRSDNIASNAGATINGSLQAVALAYIKGFAVRTGFVRAISVPLG
jgi:hypothetical protein